MHPTITRSLADLRQMPIGHYMALANRLFDAGLAESQALPVPERPSASDRIMGTLLGLWGAEYCLNVKLNGLNLVALGWRSAAAAEVARTVMRDFSIRVTGALIEPNVALHPHFDRSDCPVISNFADLKSQESTFFIGLDWLDAFPTHQFVRMPGGWHEHVVTLQNGILASALLNTSSQHLEPMQIKSTTGNVLAEKSELRALFCDQMAQYLAKYGGAACFRSFGQTNAVEQFSVSERHRDGRESSPFTNPGQQRLTSLVCFQDLIEAAHENDLSPQLHPLADWLASVGAGKLMLAMAKLNPSDRHMLEDALAQLAQPLSGKIGNHILLMTAA